MIDGCPSVVCNRERLEIAIVCGMNVLNCHQVNKQRESLYYIVVLWRHIFVSEHWI